MMSQGRKDSLTSLFVYSKLKHSSAGRPSLPKLKIRLRAQTTTPLPIPSQRLKLIKVMIKCRRLND
jgi:hypothetical protein